VSPAGAAFAVAVVVGGSNYVAVRYSNRELDPLWGAGLRFALAALAFGLICAALRLPLPRGRALALSVLYGLLGFTAAYGCLYWAMQKVPAGIAAVVLAVGPLLTLLLAVAHGLERLRVRALVAALVAIAGSVLIFFQPGSVSFGLGSLALLLLASLAASESVVVTKSIGPLDPFAVNFVAMTAGALTLIAVSALAGEELALPEAGKTQVAVAYLGLATVVLFVSVLYLIQHWPASSAAYTFVSMPVVAVALGALIAGEEVTATTILGGLVVCGAVYLGAVRRAA
jgi:drug/metabolite transporter (DMT)-like permease